MGIKTVLGYLGRKNSRPNKDKSKTVGVADDTTSISKHEQKVQRVDSTPSDSSRSDQSSDQTVDIRLDYDEEQAKRKQRRAQRTSRLLADPVQVEKYFGHIICGKTTAPKVIESMSKIKYETKVEMVRTDILAGGVSLPEFARKQYFNPKNDDAVVEVKIYNEESAAHNEAFSGEIKPLKRKRRSASSLRSTTSVRSVGDMKRKKPLSRSGDTEQEPRVEPSKAKTSHKSQPSTDARLAKEIQAHIASMKNIHETFTPRTATPSESNTIQAGNQPAEVTFEEPLRQLLMFVRCESPQYVEEFSQNALTYLIETIQLLADKEFRPAHETKTLRALLSILLALVKCGQTSNRKPRTTDDTSCSAPSSDFQAMLLSLIKMKYSSGESRRGFSNFRDRRLVVDILTAYVTTPSKQTLATITNTNTTSEALREQRAKQVLTLLRDSSTSTSPQPTSPSFMDAMKISRPYTSWVSELRKSTEGFGGVGWIWHNRGNQLKLHVRSPSGNTISTYFDEFAPEDQPRSDSTCSTVRSHTETLVTCYIAACIDLMTVCISSMPRVAERKEARSELRASFFDDLLLKRFLRASAMNFPVVHTAINAWFRAAQADGEGEGLAGLVG